VPTIAKVWRPYARFWWGDIEILLDIELIWGGYSTGVKMENKSGGNI